MCLVLLLLLALSLLIQQLAFPTSLLSLRKFVLRDGKPGLFESINLIHTLTWCFSSSPPYMMNQPAYYLPEAPLIP